MRPLMLASSSPRRRELLFEMGIPFETCSPRVDEQLVGQPRQVVRTLAKRKALAALALHPQRTILAADTLVCVNGQVLGKPEDLADAARMLRLLSGAWHEVYTGLCLLHQGRQIVAHARTLVQFCRLSELDVQAYCQSGEAMGKAGAYAIQGIAGMYVRQIRGSYTNVVGLPTALVRRLLMAHVEEYKDGIIKYGTHRA